MLQVHVVIVSKDPTLPEVSTAVQEKKHLRTSWSYNWRAALDIDGGVVRER